MKVCIVGGVAGGATAAARIRRLDENAEIIVFEKSGYVSYANCGLPYYIGGVIEDKEDLTLKTPEDFMSRYRVEVRVNSEVTAIDREAKLLTVKKLSDGSEYTESYDKLLLSPGAKPIRPRIPGADIEGVYTLRTVEDTLKLREVVVQQKPGSAAVIGGGFIGLEMAENLCDLGIATDIIVRSRQLLPPLDEDMAHIIHTTFRKNGVRLLFGKNTASFERTEKGVLISFEDGDTLLTDMVILAVGVSPDSALAKAAGLATGAKGSIAVDEHMQTSDPDIYAVGDAVEISHLVTGKKTVIALAGPANKEARIAADNICGIKSAYKGSAASSVIKIFERTVAITGINEKTAKAEGIDYEKVVLFPANHAGYYPGAKNMTLKLLFEKGSGRILGSQIVGFEGVDKRSDVIATAMQAGLTAAELRELDLAYAPPYSSA
ncbi:MAG: FAD-dependent oxidoreductase, partial [Oscillospiraceae bacterium]|nr:FAD-dependent oxidoreductase [Oscillospiraceae bacterium]